MRKSPATKRLIPSSCAKLSVAADAKVKSKSKQCRMSKIRGAQHCGLACCITTAEYTRGVVAIQKTADGICRGVGKVEHAGIKSGSYQGKGCGGGWQRLLRH